LNTQILVKCRFLISFCNNFYAELFRKATNMVAHYLAKTSTHNVVLIFIMMI